MSTIVTLDKAGRVIIPKTLRDEPHLEPGDTLESECEGESVTLRPVLRITAAKGACVWVFRANKRLSGAATEKALQHVRDQRDGGNRGLK